MPSMLLSIIVNLVLYLSCEKNKNKQKEAGFGPLKKLVGTVQFVFQKNLIKSKNQYLILKIDPGEA